MSALTSVLISIAVAIVTTAYLLGWWLLGVLALALLTSFLLAQRRHRD